MASVKDLGSELLDAVVDIKLGELLDWASISIVRGGLEVEDVLWALEFGGNINSQFSDSLKIKLLRLVERRVVFAVNLVLASKVVLDLV